MLDPDTSDYTEQGLADPLFIELKDAIHLRLKTPLGSYFADPLLGSKLYLLERAKRTERTLELAKSYALEALELLKLTHNLTDISPKSAAFSGSYLLLFIHLVTADGTRESIGYKHKVGG